MTAHARNANFLLNVSPDPDGRIQPDSRAELEELKDVLREQLALEGPPLSSQDVIQSPKPNTKRPRDARHRRSQAAQRNQPDPRLEAIKAAGVPDERWVAKHFDPNSYEEWANYLDLGGRARFFE